ncbi:MAG TPA: WD40 repeat domain-containing protein [Planctomycetota bacterium]|nr:WD40 repeat domain-containing protein [Planctomycetota bacterium]
MIFDLVKDFHDALAAMPASHPRHHILSLLKEAIRRDIHFIARHPTTLFQCTWNSCWWYDCPEAAELGTSVRRWRDEKQCQTPGFRWLRLERATRSSGVYHHTIPFEGEPVAASTSADGRRIALCSGERVRLINRDSDSEILRLPADVGFRYSTVALSADGSLLGCAQWSQEAGTICLVLDTYGSRERTFRVPDGELLSVVFAKDGKKLAACGVSSRAGWVGVFDLQSGELLWRYATPGRLMRKVIFSRDDASVIAAGGDGVCTIWSTVSGAHLKDIRCHAGGVSDISLSPSGESVMSVGKDGSCRIWPTGIHSRRVRATSVLDSPPDTPLIVGTFLDDSAVAVADFGGNVFHVSLSRRTTPAKILGCGRGTVRLASAAGGSLLMVAASGDQQCHLVDLPGALDVGGLESPQVQAVDYTHAGHSVTVTQHAGHMRSFDIAEPNWQQHASRRPVSLGKPIAASAVSSCRFHLLVTHDGQWWLRDTVDGVDARGRFSARMEAGSVVSVSPNGRIVCVFARERLEWVFVDTGRHTTLSVPMVACAVRLSDDGTVLVLGHGCRFNKLWPRDVIAIWFSPHAASGHRIAGPFGSELAVQGIDLLVSEDDAFITSRVTAGGCVVTLWNLVTLEQTAERCFSEPAKLMCLRSGCKQVVVYIPTLSECHIMDTTAQGLDDQWVLPVANALAFASIRPTGDLVTTCDQQGTVSMFSTVGLRTASAQKERVHLCSGSSGMP